MNEHKLMQYAPGTRGNVQGQRRKTVCCRACPNKNDDGTRNHRETSYYCAACQMGFHPECFTHFCCWDKFPEGREVPGQGQDSAGPKKKKKRRKNKGALDPEPNAFLNGHMLMQHLPGTRGASQGLRRKTSLCRGCPPLNEDGTKRNRDTSYYCCICNVGYHPECFATSKCWECSAAVAAQLPLPISAAALPAVPKARKGPALAAVAVASTKKAKAKAAKPVKAAKAVKATKASKAAKAAKTAKAAKATKTVQAASATTSAKPAAATGKTRSGAKEGMVI